MATIDLKLKTYDELIFEITTLNTNLFLKDKEIERYKNIIDELEEELERETNIKEEDTGLEHNTYIDINKTLKKVLNRLKELKGE